MSTRTLRRPGHGVWISIVFLLVLIVSLSSCGDDDDGSGSDGGLVISDVWARPVVLLDDSGDEQGADATPEEGEMDMGFGTTNGVVYMTIENEGDEDDTLVSATTDVAKTVELHTVNMSEGVMQMRPVEGGIEIPAGETVVLESGGLHAMMIGLNRGLEVGDTFEIELEFENAGSMTLEVEVREP